MDVIPNTSLVIIVCYSLLSGKFRGASLGLFIGFIQDFIFYNTIGVHALIYFIIGFNIGSFEEKIYRDNPLVSVFFTVFATIGYNILFFTIMYFSSYDITITYVVNKQLFVEVIYNSIVSVFIFKRMALMFKKPYINFD